MTSLIQRLGPIVVGIDGSDASKAAFAWAIYQADLVGSPLTAVCAWEWPSNYGVLMTWPEDVDFAAIAHDTLESTVTEILGGSRPAGFTQQVVHSHPATVLTDYSRSASLIVVGSRGHGEFVGILLGSVSEYLAVHAHCPTVIVRANDREHD